MSGWTRSGEAERQRARRGGGALDPYAARRYTVRLRWRSSMEAQRDVNLDPRDGEALRAVLEELVHAARGTLRLDLSQFSLTVHSPGGGRVHAVCRVTPAGATEVTR